MAIILIDQNLFSGSSCFWFVGICNDIVIPESSCGIICVISWRNQSFSAIVITNRLGNWRAISLSGAIIIRCSCVSNVFSDIVVICSLRWCIHIVSRWRLIGISSWKLVSITIVNCDCLWRRWCVCASNAIVVTSSSCSNCHSSWRSSCWSCSGQCVVSSDWAVSISGWNWISTACRWRCLSQHAILKR